MDDHAILRVAGDRITAILEWESAKSGRPALDIGWWQLAAPDRAAAALGSLTELVSAIPG